MNKMQVLLEKIIQHPEWSEKLVGMGPEELDTAHFVLEEELQEMVLEIFPAVSHEHPLAPATIGILFPMTNGGLLGEQFLLELAWRNLNHLILTEEEKAHLASLEREEKEWLETEEEEGIDRMLEIDAEREAFWVDKMNRNSLSN